ncbi:MAG: GNAT family N-acetyltransferase [Pseudorhodobacter sp.]
MVPFRPQGLYDWQALLGLIRRAFASMEGRIDPPSSMHRLTENDLAQYEGEIWVTGDPAIACVLLKPKADVLYLEKLSVEPAYKRQGHARELIAVAEKRGRALGCKRIELHSRVELVENHAVFFALGFQQTGMATHPGFEYPTSLLFTKDLTRQPVFPA